MLCLISTTNNIYKLGKGDYLIYDIWICNPSIRKVKALPSVTVPYRPSYDAFVYNRFGFGISNDMTWKVVILLYFCSVDDGTTQQITLVYSQVRGDSWSLRQIDSVTPCCDFIEFEDETNDFYLKGRYYWSASRLFDDPLNLYMVPRNPYLFWFDMNDEMFGTIELPSDISISSISIMNETIALLQYSSMWDSSCIEIWLMIENDNNTYWHKQACIVNTDYRGRCRAKGIWNLDSQLLVFADGILAWYPTLPERDIPYFMSIDLVTQAKKKFYISKKRKSINIDSNLAGYLQVYNERNIDIKEEWKFSKFRLKEIYTRVFSESLYLV
ncbi:PREDICTED: uncharacterized protein LOC109166294 [Ipomoea nil]|uniref:uncharacterized protein LOC109166294 n=1 Tax=Ipomoea nil TaxID=35883 RepID=UPI0009012250|nr:PREDICTED: uncharacterized protein LOC109166294 [Ipomoea nil]